MYNLIGLVNESKIMLITYLATAPESKDCPEHSNEAITEFLDTSSEG